MYNHKSPEIEPVSVLLHILSESYRVLSGQCVVKN